MKLREVETSLSENWLSDLIKGGINKGKQAKDWLTRKPNSDFDHLPPRKEPDLDDIFKPEEAPSKILGPDGKPFRTQTKPQSRVEPETTPASELKPETKPASEPRADQTPVNTDKGPGIIRKGIDAVKNNPKKSAAAGAVVAHDYVTDTNPEYSPVDAVGRIYQRGADAVGALGRLHGAAADKSKTTSATAPTTYQEPDWDKDIFDKEDTKENYSRELSEMTKLSGQKSITQRDNVSGIVKVKEIQTLTESTDISECGGSMMGTTGNTPASLNISASAETGEEVAGMLKSIMALAGLQQFTPDMMPAEREPVVMTPEPILTGAECNHTGEGEDCPVHGMAECAMEETYDNTPEETVQDYDPNNLAHVINKISAADMATTPYQSGSNPIVKEESDRSENDVYKGLFKAYEAFKNQ